MTNIGLKIVFNNIFHTQEDGINPPLRLPPIADIIYVPALANTKTNSQLIGWTSE